MGDLHLSVLLSRLRREFSLAVKPVGKLRVRHYETPCSSVDIVFGLGVSDDQFVHMMIEPVVVADDDLTIRHFDGVVIEHSADNPMDNLSRQCLNALNHGVRSGLSSGPAEREQVVNVRVSVKAIRNAPRELNELSFAISSCVRECLRRSGCFVLRPMALVSVDLSTQADEETVRKVIGALVNRQANIISAGASQVLARGPIEKLTDLCVQLRALSSGNAATSIDLDGYERVKVSH